MEYKAETWIHVDPQTRLDAGALNTDYIEKVPSKQKISNIDYSLKLLFLVAAQFWTDLREGAGGWSLIRRCHIDTVRMKDGDVFGLCALIALYNAAWFRCHKAAL